MLACEILGEGPAVVFIHGTPSPPEDFRSVARALASRHLTVLLHLPGYGNSSFPKAGWSFDDVYEDIEATLIARGVTRAAFVGFSGGTYHAFALALRRKIEPTAVVGLGGFATKFEQPELMHQFAAMLRGNAPLRGIAGPRFLSAKYRDAHPEAIEHVEGWLNATTRAHLADELERVADAPGLTASFDKLGDLPIVMRVGSEDVATPRAFAEPIVKAAKNGKLEVVEGAGHALLLEDAEGTLASIARAVG